MVLLTQCKLNRLIGSLQIIKYCKENVKHQKLLKHVTSKQNVPLSWNKILTAIPNNFALGCPSIKTPSKIVKKPHLLFSLWVRIVFVFAF